MQFYGLGRMFFTWPLKEHLMSQASPENPELTAEFQSIILTGVYSFKNLNLILVKSALKMHFKYILYVYKNI